MKTVLKIYHVVLVVFCLAVTGHSCADPLADNRPALDRDEDGYGARDDCDDNDRHVHPAAPEQQNCRDDNCDGKADEGTPNADLDQDGYCPSTGDAKEHGCEGDRNRHPAMAEDGGNGSGAPNGVDDNCNGLVDEGLATSDVDQDGYSVADSDCNDNDPLVNPGAVEVEGRACIQDEDCPATGKCIENYCRCEQDEDCSSRDLCTEDAECKGGETCDDSGVCRGTWRCLEAAEGMGSPQHRVCRDGIDNDCNGATDEMPSACDDLTELVQSDPFDFAKSMEICPTKRTCNLDQPCPAKLNCLDGRCHWVRSASFNPDAHPDSRAIAARLAKATTDHGRPRKNQSFVILSSGRAIYDPYDKTDQERCPQGGKAFNTVGKDPDPSAPVWAPEANDLSQLRLELLVPSNARSFSFDFHFLTTEYPEFLGSVFNDTFWVELASQRFTGNISFDKKGTPIRLNNAYFDICDPDETWPQTSQFCAEPASALEGTGYNKECSGMFSIYPEEAAGGGTGWLVTTAPVTPGEVITLTFSIFDKGDHILDSVVLIDNFRWNLSPAKAPFTGPL